MRTIVNLLTIVTLFAAVTQAQEADRVLHFSTMKSSYNLEEIATVIRAISAIPKIGIDTSEQSLSLHGTAEQVALCEWLFTNLDKPNAPPSAAKHEYRVSDSADDVVRLFFLTNPEIPRGVREVATVVRSLVNARQLFVYDDLGAVAVRGTEEEIRTVEFLLNEMDKPAVHAGPNLRSSASPEFRMNQQPENLVRVFYLPNTKTVRDFQEVATLVRSIMDDATPVHVQRRTGHRSAWNRRADGCSQMALREFGRSLGDGHSFRCRRVSPFAHHRRLRSSYLPGPRHHAGALAGNRYSSSHKDRYSKIVHVHRAKRDRDPGQHRKTSASRSPNPRTR